MNVPNKLVLVHYISWLSSWSPPALMCVLHLHPNLLQKGNPTMNSAASLWWMLCVVFKVSSGTKYCGLIFISHIRETTVWALCVGVCWHVQRFSPVPFQASGWGSALLGVERGEANLLNAAPFFSLALTWQPLEALLSFHEIRPFHSSGPPMLMFVDLSHDQRHVRTWTPCLNAVHEATLLLCCCFPLFPARMDIHCRSLQIIVISLCQLHAAAAVGKRWKQFIDQPESLQ